METNNYVGESIPDIDILQNEAKKVLNAINSACSIKIKGNIVEIIDGQPKYIARKYFRDNIKNTRSYKSKEPNDFSGLYIFYSNNKPVYVGISGTIIRRMKYHLFGKKDNESSFVYLVAKNKFEKEKGKKHSGKRRDFPFETYRAEIQNEMIDKWNFKYYPIENGYLLSFIEIYVSCALKTKWNTFKTH